MTAPMLARDQASIWELMFGDGTPRRAFATALVVGTILTAINHGDLIIAGSVPTAAKVALTYLVPYCVATWGAICGKKALLRRDTSRQERSPQREHGTEG